MMNNGNIWALPKFKNFSAPEDLDHHSITVTSREIAQQAAVSLANQRRQCNGSQRVDLRVPSGPPFDVTDFHLEILTPRIPCPCNSNTPFIAIGTPTSDSQLSMVPQVYRLLLHKVSSILRNGDPFRQFFFLPL